MVFRLKFLCEDFTNEEENEANGKKRKELDSRPTTDEANAKRPRR